MVGNHFVINGGWAWRPESPEQIGEKFLRTLDALSTINPLFRPWGMVDHKGEPSDRLFPLKQVRARFTDIVERGVYTLDDGEPFPAGGYSVSACNRKYSSPSSVALGIHAGDNGKFGRDVQFGTSSGQIPDPSIVAYPVFKSVLKTLVSVWGVRHAQAFSHDLMRHWDYSPFKFDLDWMVYLSAPLASQIAPPEGVVVERTDDGGLLLIAAEDTFDTKNPEHMRAAHAIRDALGPINDLPQHERDLQDKLDADRHLLDMGLHPVSCRKPPSS